MSRTGRPYGVECYSTRWYGESAATDKSFPVEFASRIDWNVVSGQAGRFHSKGQAVTLGREHNDRSFTNPYNEPS